jgi:hypothetical protein
MPYKELQQHVEELLPRLTPVLVAKAVRALLHQGEDVGGGINATRLVKHLLGSPQLNDAQTVWAYDHLKPTLRIAFEQIPSLYYFEGD